MKINAEPAFVLHSRPYRETSLLVDFFSRHHGRFRAVARGVRGAKKHRSSLNSFVPYLISWSGKSELKTLLNFEPSGSPIFLTGDCLYCGFYLNELLIRLVTEHDPHQNLFDGYLNVLIQLAGGTPVEPSLRKFELSLLSEIGYALSLDTDALSGDPVEPDHWYQFDPMLGVSQLDALTLSKLNQGGEKNKAFFRGQVLLDMVAGDYRAPATNTAAKRLMRMALQPHIGSTPLQSRTFFERKTP